MANHTEIADPEDKSERAPRNASVVGSTRACEICGKALTGRPQQKCCSAKCRAAKSRRKRVHIPMADAKEIRASLTDALEAVWGARTMLDRHLGA